MVKLTLVLPSSVEPTELEAASTLKILFAAKINGIADSIKCSTDSSLGLILDFLKICVVIKPVPRSAGRSVPHFGHRRPGSV